MKRRELTSLIVIAILNVQPERKSIKICLVFAVLKSELMAKLDKEVKSLDEDSWMFDGPRSRINLISRPGIAVDS